MENPLLVLGAMAGLAVVYVLVPIFLVTLAKYRQGSKVICPLKRREANLTIDARWAALTAVAGQTRVRVRHCPILHKGETCDQACTSGL